MKMKPRTFERFEGEGFYERDYKLEHLENVTRKNFESTKGWLYLGADIDNPRFAKVGITMDDLSSRSYSSARPTYYIFCAFKFYHNITTQKAERVENDILFRIDEINLDRYRNTQRLRHYESGRLSECYQPVDFVQFYKDLHFEIYTHHRDSFMISGYEDDWVEFVSCIFNPRLGNPDPYIQMILQTD